MRESQRLAVVETAPRHRTVTHNVRVEQVFEQQALVLDERRHAYAPRSNFARR
ncbi:hypothetical protein LG3211_3577 [Lysobacter gummosus]|nr:hypothetical protein LG3211_3577 [Lysobacter gummosus]